MSKRICGVCGLMLAETVTVCPCCRQSLPPRAKQALADAKGLFAGGKRKELQRSIDFLRSQYRWDS